MAQALEQVDYVEDPHLGKGTCCVVGINADGGACSVPDFAVLRLFWHIVVGESPDTIVREIEKAVQRAGITGRYEICFREAPSEGSRGFMPYTVPQDDPMTVSLLESIRKVTGKEPTISYFASIGDFNYLGTRLGAPAIIFGATARTITAATNTSCWTPSTRPPRPFTTSWRKHCCPEQAKPPPARSRGWSVFRRSSPARISAGAVCRPGPSPSCRRPSPGCSGGAGVPHGQFHSCAPPFFAVK